MELVVENYPLKTAQKPWQFFASLRLDTNTFGSRVTADDQIIAVSSKNGVIKMGTLSDLTSRYQILTPVGVTVMSVTIFRSSLLYWACHLSECSCTDVQLRPQRTFWDVSSRVIYIYTERLCFTRIPPPPKKKGGGGDKTPRTSSY